MPISFSNHGLEIPDAEFEFKFARSGGAGGQNVNKVSSQVQLRWCVRTSPSLPDDVRARFLEQYGSRLNADGSLLLTCQSQRKQLQNRAECLEKLRDMIASVLTPPTPRTASEVPRASKRKRLEDKRQRSKTKQQRNGSWTD